MEKKPMNEKESLAVIQQMIFAAKMEQKDDGKGWIIWGWLIFIASILSFINLRTGWFNEFFFWNIFGFVTILLLGFITIQNFIKKRNKQVKTYTKDLFAKLDIGFIILLFLIILSMNTSGVHPTKGFALLLGLYGFWILIYGAVLNFRPSIIGAYIVWAFALASLYVPSFEWTMLLHAIAVLCGYIIPGHMANIEFNKLNQEVNTLRV